MEHVQELKDMKRIRKRFSNPITHTKNGDIFRLNLRSKNIDKNLYNMSSEKMYISPSCE